MVASPEEFRHSRTHFWTHDLLESLEGVINRELDKGAVDPSEPEVIIVKLLQPLGAAKRNRQVEILDELQRRYRKERWIVAVDYGQLYLKFRLN